MTAATTGLGIRAIAVVRRADRGGDLHHVGVGEVGHLLDVVAGGEDALAAPQHHGAYVVALAELGGGLAEVGLDLDADRVHLGPVQPQDARPRRSRRSRRTPWWLLTSVRRWCVSWAHSAVTADLYHNGSRDTAPRPNTVWNHDGETRRGLAGSQLPPGCDVARGVDQLRRLRAQRRAVWVCLFDDDGVETRHQLTEHSLGVWHGALPGRVARHALRLPRRRPVGPRRRAAVQRRQAAARPLRQGGVRRPRRRRRRSSATPWATPRSAATSTRRRTSRAASSSTTTSSGARTPRRGAAGATR